MVQKIFILWKEHTRGKYYQDQATWLLFQSSQLVQSNTVDVERSCQTLEQKNTESLT